MKVIHINADDYLGAGLCALRICQSLRELGVDSQMLVRTKTHPYEWIHDYGFTQEMIDRIPSKLWRMMGIVGVTERNAMTVISNNYHGIFTRPVSPVDLSCQPLVKEADIIHLHWINGYVDYPSFFSKVRKPIVMTLHDENLFCGIAHYTSEVIPDEPLEQKYRKVKYEAIHAAGNLSIVFLSKMLSDKFGNENIICGRPKYIIHNSVNTSLYKPFSKKEMRTRYGIPQDAVVFAQVAIEIYDTRKGLTKLIHAVDGMDIPNKMILAIGGNPQGIHHPLVRETGTISNPGKMSELLSCADYFVMPSSQEAFAQTPLEAMACGLPAIVFPCSGTEELITAENGVRCKGFEVSDLRQGIHQAMQIRYNHDRIRENVKVRFSPETIAKQYLRVYRNALG